MGDFDQAARYAAQAEALRAIETQIAALAASAEGLPACVVLDDAPPAAEAGPPWHRGVIGILASRVVDRTGLPALILTSDETDAHGSGRSINGYHLLDALTEADADGPGIFTRFGGHAHAVGFSLPAQYIPVLRARMQLHSRGTLLPAMLAPPIACDLELACADVTLDLLRWIDRCAPFGMGAPEPVLLVRNLKLSAAPRIIKEKHVCLPLGKTAAGKPLSAMGWSRTGRASWAERIAGMALEAGTAIDIVGRLRENTHPQFGGIELELVDIAFPAQRTELSIA